MGTTVSYSTLILCPSYSCCLLKISFLYSLKIALRLLLIISQFSPSQTPNTLRWSPLAQHLVAQGHEVYVLTTKHSGYPNEETQDGLRIYRAGHNTLMDKLYNTFRSDNRRNEVNASIPREGFIYNLVQKLTDKTWRSNYWPDGGKLFLKPGIQKGNELIAKHAITHMISVGLPFTSHWIAKSLKEKHSQLQWHMDIQDPFSYSKEFWVNNFTKHQDKNIAAEQEAFRLADSSSVTNERAKEKYQELFPESTSNMKVIPPLFHLPEEKEAYDMILFSQKIHLGYFGSFYDGVRSPLMFLKFLKYLHEEDNSLFDKIQFHFVGQLDRNSYPLFDLYTEIRRYMVIHGFKNRAETLDAMSQVDILMNFGNSTDYHLPSKVVDYLYLNKPILNLCAVENDSTKVFMQGHEDIQNLLLDEAHFPALAERFYEFVFRERERPVAELGRVTAYRTEAIAEEYLQNFLS